MRAFPLLLSTLVVACELTPPPPAAPPPPVHAANEALIACAAAGLGVTDILGAVRQLSVLPAPVNAPCFVAALPRPLALMASSGVTSAQPSAGVSSPRIFVMLPKLVVSVVPEGSGARLLEFGEWVSTTHTLKGELEFPLDGGLTDDSPFAHVRYGQPATTCGLCHREESPHPTLPGAYVSLAYRPNRNQTISAAQLAVEHQLCVTAKDDTGRCALFHALFDFGEVTQGAFAGEVATFP